MTTAKTRRAKQPAADWRSPGLPDGLGEAEQAAHAIITTRPDLTPSVARIMDAGLEADDRLRALGLFEAALTVPGDVNRDPRLAIANCRADIAR